MHRDLKPGNVVITKAGAKLLAFGLAKGGAVVEEDMGTIVGTMQYMSPEEATRPGLQSIHTQRGCVSLILEVSNVEQPRHCESH